MLSVMPEISRNDSYDLVGMTPNAEGTMVLVPDILVTVVYQGPIEEIGPDENFVEQFVTSKFTVR